MARRLLASVLAGSVVVIIGACGSEDAPAPAPEEIAFHGAVKAIPNFNADTGWQPEGSPVQVRFVASAAGELVADAKARAGGAAASPEVVGVPAGGAFAMDVHVKFEARIKINLPGMTYEGPLQNAPAIDIAFAGHEAFDPFLVGGHVDTTGEAADTQLATIPLAGAVPIPGIGGQLVIRGGGKLVSSFTGVCAAASDGKAEYVGATSTSGALRLVPTLELTGPLGLSKKIEGLTIPIPVDPIPAALPFGTVPIPPGRAAPPPPASPSAKAKVGTCSGVDAGASTPPSDGGAEATVSGQDAATDVASGDATPSCAGTTTCQTGGALGAISGDTSPASNGVTTSGNGSAWFAVQVTENDNGVGGKAMSARAQLATTTGANYDLYVWMSPSAAPTARVCNMLAGSSTLADGLIDEVNLSWGEGVSGNNSDDTRIVMLEVRHIGGPCDAAYPWTLTMTRVP